jgi:hypothetical protein
VPGKHLPSLAGVSLLCAFTEDLRSSSSQFEPGPPVQAQKKIFLPQINHLRAFSAAIRTLIHQTVNADDFKPSPEIAPLTP